MSSPGAVVSSFLEDPAAAAALPQWVLTYAHQEQLFPSGNRVLVAVSGGPDSVALLHLLVNLRKELGLDLGVGHFDHGLRGPESQDDAAWVAQLAQSLNLPCHQGRGDVRGLSRREKTSLQMAGRKLRLNFLQETRRTHGYHRLALGHTADDQVELFWLRLLRGAGPEGLKGMWPATPEGLVRPLLAVGKAVILAWLHREAIPYRQDATNLSRAYLRNRVRLDLLPQLTRFFNPRLHQAIWRTQTLLQEDARLLSQETARAWTSVCREGAADFFSVNLPRFFSLAPVLQKRLLRTALGKIEPDRGLTLPQVAALLELAGAEQSGGTIALGQCRVSRAGPELHFYHRFPDPHRHAPTLLPAPPCRVESPTGWQWRLSSRPHDRETPWPAPPSTARLDREKVTFPLTVRYFRAGDRFRPQGAPGPKKLQDFLVDHKIPRYLRPHLPLVTGGEEIIWVPGLRVAEPAKVTPNTRTVLEIEMSPRTAATRRIWEIFLSCRPAAAG